MMSRLRQQQQQQQKCMFKWISSIILSLNAGVLDRLLFASGMVRSAPQVFQLDVASHGRHHTPLYAHRQDLGARHVLPQSHRRPNSPDYNPQSPHTHLSGRQGAFQPTAQS